jgi:allophanate hydrolase
VNSPSDRHPLDADRELLSLADWRAAMLAGADVLAALRERARRIAQSACPAAWITPVSSDALAVRLAELQAMLEACTHAADRAALLERMPLFGVPFAVKDNIDVAGMPTTAACPAASTVPAASATAVRRLLAAGAVLMGKTNLDQFATGLVGTRTPYGVPASSWAADRVSGGSSSGSAVAVAQGEVAFALGTDTAGSGRIPAGFNHLVGLKPTPGRVSTAGVMPACQTLDCVSVFARTVDDSAAVLAVLEGADGADPYSHFVPGPQAWSGKPGARRRVGVPMAPLLDADDAYPVAWQEALQHLETLGWEAVPLNMELLSQVAALLYEGPWVAERLSVVEGLLARDPAALDPTVRAVIERGHGLTAVDAFRGQYRLAALRAQAEDIWQTVDVMMVPTAPGHPSLALLQQDPIGANARLGTYTNFVNLLGWSALALPSGVTPIGLPFGVTFIAPGAHEVPLLALGRLWERQAAQAPGAPGRAAPRPAAASMVAQPAVEPQMPLVVVGAHLSGMPLNAQLTERGAVRLVVTRTAPRYRLFALANTVPPKPGLQRVADGGVAIEVELWSMPQRHVGSFLALVPQPLGLGSLELEDGQWCHGFICEPHALADATDITAWGGWRAWLAARQAAGAAASPSPANPLAPQTSAASALDPASTAPTAPVAPIAPE